jgi:ParB/RepB/Spo0J family partition protein
MPSKFEGLLGRKDELRVDPESIDADHGENFSRYESVDNDTDRAADAELAKSIMEHGQLQAVVITKVNGRAKLRAGFRRLRVIRDIINPKLKAEGKEPMPVMARLIDGNEDDGFLMNLEENIRRKNLTPMDCAMIISRLATHYGKSDTEIAALFGSDIGKPRSVAWVSQHRSLLTLDKETRDKVHTGEIALSSALTLVTMTPDERKAVIELATEMTPEPEPEKVEPVQNVTVVDGDAPPAETSAAAPPKPVEVPAPKPAKKLKPKTVADAARKVTGKNVARTLKEVKDFLTKYSTDNPAFTCEALLDFIEGKTDEDGLLAKAVDKDEAVA